MKKTDNRQGEYNADTDDVMSMLGKGYNNDPIPPTQFISTISGVTPAPDLLVNEYGFVTALVWGRVWRNCQMYDGVCRAAVDTIAEGLGMSGKTITRHLDVLCQDGYLFDMTPDLRNKPHIYADTHKLIVKISFEVGRTESPSAKTLSPSHTDRESVEESTTKGKDSKNLFTHYEENIGILTPMIADHLKDAEKLYPMTWIIESFQLAVTNNKRNWRYCEEILKRWKEQGKDEGKGKPTNKTTDSKDARKPLPTFVNGRMVTS